MLDRLETLDEAGNPPASRIKDAASLREIWNNLRIADGESSLERAKHDAMYDNERPFSADRLAASGQSYRVNVSWGWGDMVLEMAMAGYVDIINAVENLFECPTTYGPEMERQELEGVVAEEVSNCIRSWPDFYPNYLRLCSSFIKHGVGIALPNDESDWRWTATDLSDFKIPRKTKIGQENINIACCLRFYSASDLYKMIEDPDTAEDVGFNVKAIRQTIREMVDNNEKFHRYHGYEWEQLQVELRNNDLFFTNGAANAESARVVHAWIKEFDGKVSHYMINDDNEKDQFLYKKIGRFDNVYQAYTVFTFGVGTNGYYHGVRGQGYKVFPIHGALNIAACQMLEVATYGSAVTFQPDSESAMQEMQFLPTGPYNLITPGVKVLKDSVAPNVSQNALPVLQQFSQMFRDRTAQYNTEQLINSSVEKSKFQVQSELGAVSKMSVSAISLFYMPMELLEKEMIRRMKRRSYTKDEPGGDFIIDLRKRLLQRGQSGIGPKDRYLEAFYELDVDRLTVTKAIGAGSESARILAFDRLMSMYGSYPDFGKKTLTWDITAAVVGNRNAQRYAVRPGADEVPTVDASIAQLENNILMMGGEVKIIDGQNDLVHAKVHLQFLAPILQQAEEALQVDPMSLAGTLPGINMVNQHSSEHVEKLSQDPLMKQESAEMRKVLQNADEILHNGILKVQKLQQEAEKEQMYAQGEQQQGGIDPETLAKIEGDRELRQAKMVQDAEIHQQRMIIQREEAAQKLALADAEMHNKLMQSGVRA